MLDVMQEQDLVGYASELGARWLAMLRERLADNPAVGDVRGRGLFIGVELVSNRSTRAPDREGASTAVQLMKQKDIQISIDGPRYNVLKIKPPMVISEEQACRVVDALGRSLGELA